MLLVGRDLSPFVRRCAVTLHLYGLPFERAEYATTTDVDKIRVHNRLVRVPALVLDDGETLIDSTAILDHLDETAGDKRLTPAGGAERRAVLRDVYHALGAAEKAILVAYERNPGMRDQSLYCQPWVDRLLGQAGGGLAVVEETLSQQEWLACGRMTQADVTAAVVYDFLTVMVPELASAEQLPALAGLTERLSKLPAFQQTNLDKFRK